MPGRTGGGNSGSFSGGSHSGGFSGGGQTGGFSGGSRPGGFSGGHMGPPPGMHGGRPPYGGGAPYGGRPPYGGRHGRGGIGCGVFPFIVIAFIFITVFSVNAGIFSLVGNTVKSFFKHDTPTYPHSIETEYDFDYDDSVFQPRKRLPESLCKRVDEVIIDSDGVYPEKDRERLTNILDELYRLTGVQSVVMFKRVSSNTYNPEYGNIDDFMYNSYMKLFDDEGHILFFFAVDKMDNYTSWYICGDNTEGVFDEYDAQSVLGSVDSFAEAGHEISFCVYHAFETVSSLLSHEFETEIAAAESAAGTTENATDAAGTTEETALSEEEPSAEVTEDTAENERTESAVGEESTTEFYHPEVTMPTQTYNGITAKELVLYVLSLVAVAVVFLMAVWMFKRHIQRTRDENYQAHKEANDHSHDNENPYMTNDSSSLPVRCPKCGALGALTENGCCRYCGEKIK